MITTKNDDVQNQNKDKTSLKHKNYRLLIYIGIMICLNFIMSGLVKTGQAMDLDGHLASDSEVKRSTIRTLLFGFTVIGFILGSILNLIPYKKLNYRKKYIFFSLLSVLILHVLTFILVPYF